MLMPYDPLILGRNIMARRKELGLTQHQIAIQCGVTKAAIHFWENGTATPTLARVGLLADALHTTIAALLGEERDPIPNGHDQAVA